MKNRIVNFKNGINIFFTDEVKKENIVSMVQNCKQGQCECMSEETKQKITNMEVTDKEGVVKLTLDGSITEIEIRQALANSKILNKF